MTRFIDISLTITNQLPIWTGDPPLLLERVASLALGASANVSRLETSVHIGTHVDAPLHFIDGGAPIDQLELDRFIGECQVVELGGSGPISAAELEEADIQTRRLLLKTSNSAFWEHPEPVFQRDFRALGLDAARWVVERGIRLVGIDYLSIEPYKQDPSHQVHITLLSQQIAIVEGLRLGHVNPGRYQLICLPLKLGGSDGAPARAVLMEQS